MIRSPHHPRRVRSKLPVMFIPPPSPPLGDNILLVRFHEDDALVLPTRTISSIFSAKSSNIPDSFDILRRLFQNRLDFLHGVLRLAVFVHVFDSFLLLQLFFILDFILVRDGTLEQRARLSTPRGSFLIVHNRRSSSRATKGTKS